MARAPSIGFGGPNGDIGSRGDNGGHTFTILQGTLLPILGIVVRGLEEPVSRVGQFRHGGFAVLDLESRQLPIASNVLAQRTKCRTVGARHQTHIEVFAKDVISGSRGSRGNIGTRIVAFAKKDEPLEILSR